MTFILTVPGTEVELAERDHGLVADEWVFTSAGGGIWDLIRPERSAAFATFAEDYAAVRSAEHRDMTPGEIQKLPTVRPDHPLADMWQQRAASHQRFTSALADIKPGCALDIGAGCGWLAADLARKGWQAAAIDVTIDGGDGLSAARHHGAQLLLARAEMEALPFKANSIDLAVFNASLHYAGCAGTALSESARVVRPGGFVVVLDSPIFADPTAGHAMVQEFAAHTIATLGLEAAEHAGPGFLSEADLDSLDFRQVDPPKRLRSRLHQWRGARRLGREAASRPLLIAKIGDSP